MTRCCRFTAPSRRDRSACNCATRRRLYGVGHYRNDASRSVCCWSLDRELLPRYRGLLDKLEFKDAIVVFGFARRLVQLRRQLEAAIDVAEIPLAAE